MGDNVVILGRCFFFFCLTTLPLYSLLALHPQKVSVKFDFLEVFPCLFFFNIFEYPAQEPRLNIQKTFKKLRFKFLPKPVLS